jgi:prolyl-tRNA editing enzyme YbaK/EbsC (Cys-tRNA(Pro) deacylase)
MSVDRVRSWLRRWGKDGAVREFPVSTANVELAAKAAGVIPARIAKSITFKNGTDCVMIVAAGDARFNGKKFREAFGYKMQMLSPAEALAFTGYEVGGVCPFAIINPAVEIFCDVSLRRFTSVLPACGSSNSCVELNLEELFAYAEAKAWVDVCLIPEEPAGN